MSHPLRKLFICSGLQSSGTTLVSWCFLQRADMNGVLDADNDLLPQIDQELGRPHVWYKTTICCFRLTELVSHYQAHGWEVHPLLVVRDLRSVWASLLRKPYARNGITAEDPPLRLRVRRFIDDWQAFRSAGWPILRYESVLENPEAALRNACKQMDLPWDEAMLTWPKSESEIADTRWGSETFRCTRGPGLAETLSRCPIGRCPSVISAEDLRWLETEFERFNTANGYPLHSDRFHSSDEPCTNTPSFAVTRRYFWETARKPLRWLMLRFGVPNRRLIERRSVRKVAYSL